MDIFDVFGSDVVVFSSIHSTSLDNSLVFRLKTKLCHENLLRLIQTSAYPISNHLSWIDLIFIYL